MRMYSKYCVLIFILQFLPNFVFGGDSASLPDSLCSDSLYFGKIEVVSSKIFDINTFASTIQDYKNTRLQENYAFLTDRIMSLPVSRGYYFPFLSLQRISPEYKNDTLFINPVFNLDWGERVQIDTIIFTGQKETSEKLLSREVNAYQGMVYNNRMLETINTAFSRYPFIQLQNNEEIVKTKSGNYGLIMGITEKACNEFTGAAGYIPPKSGQKGYFTGEIDLNLQNLSGMGRRISVYWSKMNKHSQQLNLEYFEPWIWKTNFFGQGKFSQTLRDTLVVIRGIKCGFGRRIGSIGNLQMNLNWQSTIPTPGGREILGLNNTRSMMGGLEFSRDTRDVSQNPTEGYNLDLKFSTGNRQEKEFQNWQFQTDFESEFNFQIFDELILSSGLLFKGRWLSDERLTYSDQFWFGGANSLRGYPEDFYCGEEIGLTSFELRWLIGQFSRVYLFFDQGYYKTRIMEQYSRKYPHSFGLGIRLESRMGIIGLDYAFGEDDTFSTAKIHLHIENRF